jgi:DNA repair protein RecN (Recombination protein N)
MEFVTRDPEIIAVWNLLSEGNESGNSIELVLRREISPQRRSRCLINDQVSTLKDLKQLTAHLLDLSGQEEAVAVDRRQTQVLLLDQIAGCEDLRRNYAKAFGEWTLARQALEKFLNDYERRQREEELNRYHHEELSAAPLEGWLGLEDLENKLLIQENALESREKLMQGAQVLAGGDNYQIAAVADQLRELLQQISISASKDTEVAAWSESLKGVLVQVRELARDAETLADARIPDLQATQLLRDQADLFQHLLHKHRLADLQDLRELRDRLGAMLGSQPGVEQDRSALVDQEAISLNQCRKAALELHWARSSRLRDLSSRAVRKLAKLSMEHARLEIAWNTAVEPLRESSKPEDLNGWLPTEALLGLDKPDLLFSANPGQEPRTLGQVASGGEKSRLLLALKSLIKEQGLEHTRIFDEIDAGISGETALRMGQMLSEMGKHQQIILITHLPQIAALGDSHWHVTKEVHNEQTRTNLSVLDPLQRKETLARMIGGDRYSQAALQQAQDLLDSGQASTT